MRFRTLPKYLQDVHTRLSLVLFLSHTRLLTFDLLGGLVTLEKLGDVTSTEQNYISLRPGAFCMLFLPSQ